jgi:hypothetical protein
MHLFTTKPLKTGAYELVKSKNSIGLIILFPCFPCDAESTLSEFKLARVAVQNSLSVLALNFIQHLFLSLQEKEGLERQLITILLLHDLPFQNVYVGGFSSGGNVGFVLTDFLIKMKSKIMPRGVFW